MNVERRLAPMPGVRRRWLPWVVLVTPAIVAAILAIWGTAHGPGTNEDSETYVCASTNPHRKTRSVGVRKKLAAGLVSSTLSDHARSA